MNQTNPTQSLPRSTPEEEGMPSQAILDFVDSLKGGTFQVHSFMLLRHGKVIAEAWWRPYDPTCRRYLYSLSKSFTSTAVGLAVQEGRLSVEDKVTSFFPDDLPPKIDENLAAMRVKHLLSMSTGHDVDTVGMANGDNWARSILAVPVALKPGTHFLYNTGATYLLSCIVQKVTGQTLMEYLTPRLFAPLGITGMTWDTCPRGINTGGWGLSLKTEDLAKFGQLYLQKGIWAGKQILSPEWVETATRKQVETLEGEPKDANTDWQQGYGYQFWRCQHNAYRGDGAYGQYCIVMPEQEVVLAITSESATMQDLPDRIWAHLLPAMGEAPLPPQPAVRQRLLERLNGLQVPLPTAAETSQDMDGISGKKFLLKTNPLGLKAISLTTEGETSCVRLWDAAREYAIEAGKGIWKTSETCLPLMDPAMVAGMLRKNVKAPVRMGAAGQWTDAQTYMMVWQYLETPHSNRLTFRFEGEALHLEVTPSLKDVTNPHLLEEGNKVLEGTMEAEEIERG